MSKKDDAVQIVNSIIKDESVASAIVYRLIEEGIIPMKNIAFGDKDLNSLISTFKECFWTTKTSRYDRYAGERLIKRHGIKTVEGVVKTLSQRSNEKFAPTVNNISQLEEKWVSVIRFLSTNEEEVDSE